MGSGVLPEGGALGAGAPGQPNPMGVQSGGEPGGMPQQGLPGGGQPEPLVPGQILGRFITPPPVEGPQGGTSPVGGR